MEAYLIVDADGTEKVCNSLPHRVYPYKEFGIKVKPYWECDEEYGDKIYIQMATLPKGTIEKLIGKKLTWKNNPYLYE